MIYYIAREKLTFIPVFSNMRNYAVHFLCNNSFYLEKSHTVSSDTTIKQALPDYTMEKFHLYRPEAGVLRLNPLQMQADRHHLQAQGLEI